MDVYIGRLKDKGIKENSIKRIKKEFMKQDINKQMRDAFRYNPKYCLNDIIRKIEELIGDILKEEGIEGSQIL